MKAADIKEYIDKNTKGIYEATVDSVFDTPSFRRMHQTLEEVKSMLDELEDRPKGKWLETGLWEDGIGDIMKCSICGHINHLDNNMRFCSSCGAKMEEEE